MRATDSNGSRDSARSTPPWWSVDGAQIPLETVASEEADLPSEIEEAHRIIRQLARLCLSYRERLDEQLKQRFGSRSEKRGRGKGDASNPQPPPPADEGVTGKASAGASEDGAVDEGSSETADANAGHGRRPIPPELPREEVEIPVQHDHCLRCEGPIHKLERVESYRYDYVPGYIRVRVLVRWRCVCNDPTCDGPFQIAKLPPEPIPKGRATAGFLAHLLVIKFADHCPLYRFGKILQRQKVELPLSTLVDYCKKSTELLMPLWELMRKLILQSGIVGTDDTHVRVRRPGKKGVLKGHLWAYKGDIEHPYVVFEFTPHWRGEAPQRFLEKFHGYLQADAYKGYDELFKQAPQEPARRVEVGCNAHARRKWVAARQSSPQVADHALELYGQLYAIEDACKTLSAEQRKAVRQERAAPVLEKLRLFMQEQKPRVLPKSPVGEAITYAQNQWQALTRYLEDGRLKIDNNEVEQLMRAVALGRKNWLAAGSDVGGETAAVAYTMMASAQVAGVDPVEWLTDVLERIVTCPEDRLGELLPDRWKAARARGAASKHADGPSAARSVATVSPAAQEKPLQAAEAAPVAATDQSASPEQEVPKEVDVSSGQSDQHAEADTCEEPRQMPGNPGATTNSAQPEAGSGAPRTIEAGPAAITKTATASRLVLTEYPRLQEKLADRQAPTTRPVDGAQPASPTSAPDTGVDEAYPARPPP